MGAHGSKEKLHRSASERYVHTQVIERERFGSFGKRVKEKGKIDDQQIDCLKSFMRKFIDCYRCRDSISRIVFVCHRVS